MTTSHDPYEALADALRGLVDDAVAHALAAATPTPVDTSALLSVGEAAARLGISGTTLKRLIASGELDSITVGRRRLIPTSAVESFAARRAS